MKKIVLLLSAVVFALVLGAFETSAVQNDPWSYSGPRYGENVREGDRVKTVPGKEARQLPAVRGSESSGRPSGIFREQKKTAPEKPEASRQAGQGWKNSDPAAYFFRRALSCGILNEAETLRYRDVFDGLPHLEHSLPILLKQEKGIKKTLDSLSRKKRSFIGPFVYYSDVRNYGKTLICHVDLRPVIEKIRSGKLRPDTADGWKVFNNYEQRLPRRQRGYYHEIRVPTEGLGGPGPQRLVYGEGGEIYYTADHYETFHKLEVMYK
ncbi:MAG: hypothetical protein J5855_03525 [Mailhella sp.]|nr:hypothetical protein [Mailhella sp.]